MSYNNHTGLYISNQTINSQSLRKILQKESFDAVVVVDQSQQCEVQINNLISKINEQNNLTKRHCSFISCGGNGVFGNIFCDFGKRFHVKDPTGKEEKKLQIHYLIPCDSLLTDKKSKVAQEEYVSRIMTRAHDKCSSDSKSLFVELGEEEKHDLSVGNNVILSNLKWKDNKNFQTSSSSSSSSSLFLNALHDVNLECQVIKVHTPHSVSLQINNMNNMSQETHLFFQGLNNMTYSFKSGTMVRLKSDESEDISFKKLQDFIYPSSDSDSSEHMNRKQKSFHAKEEDIINTHTNNDRHLMIKKNKIISKKITKRKKKNNIPSFFWSKIPRHNNWVSKKEKRSTSDMNSPPKTKSKKKPLIQQLPIVPFDWSKSGENRMTTVHVCWRYVLPRLLKQRGGRLSSNYQLFSASEVESMVLSYIGMCVSPLSLS